MQTSMTIATLLAFLCSANAATLVRERTQQVHKSAATGARTWSEEEDPFRRLQTSLEDFSLSASLSLSIPAESTDDAALAEDTPRDEAMPEPVSG